MCFMKCFGLKKNPRPGLLSSGDLEKMLASEKRKTSDLKKEIHRLEKELNFERSQKGRKSSPNVPVSRKLTPRRDENLSGWVRFMRNDIPKVWHSAWAILEKGHLKLYRGAGSNSVKVIDVDLSKYHWRLSFHDGPYASDSEAVSKSDLIGMIALNVLDEEAIVSFFRPDGYYRLYMNTGSDELKKEWMTKLELEMCRP